MGVADLSLSNMPLFVASEGTSISFNVAGATDVLNYTVNQNGIVGGSCASAGDVFVNSNGQSVGDLTSRLGVFGASAVKFDEKVTLGGVNSVLGRSVVLTSSTGTIAGCCTVGFVRRHLLEFSFFSA